MIRYIATQQVLRRCSHLNININILIKIRTKGEHCKPSFFYCILAFIIYCARFVDIVCISMVCNQNKNNNFIMERSYGEVYWTFLQDILYSQSFPIFVLYLTFVALMTGKPYRKYITNVYKDAPENKSFERYIKYVSSY